MAFAMLDLPASSAVYAFAPHFSQREPSNNLGATTRLCRPRARAFVHPLQQSLSVEEENQLLDKRLSGIASKLKLEVFDLDENLYGFDSQDQRFGLEVVKTNVSIDTADSAIGLVLTEIASAQDGRGLVLIREVAGKAASAVPVIHVGDVITGVWAGHGRDHLRERTTGLDYDLTVECLNKAKDVAVKTDGVLTLQLNRLIKRASIRVEVEDGSGKMEVIEALAGENLRRLLLRKGIKLYDPQTKRFDMPYATGDCAGDGLCGTCLVAVREGEASLNEKDHTETLITRGRPASWRASCRTVVGADNKPATVRVSIHPQSRFADELDPGVRTLGGAEKEH